MSLRIKTFLVLFSATLCFIVVAGFSLGHVILGWFADLEAAAANKDLERAERALHHEIEGLQIKASDWANWDDSYRFCSDRNENFIASNINAPALTMLHIDQMLWYSPTGQLVYGVALAAEGAELVQLTQSFLQQPSYSALLQRSGETDVKSGIIEYQGAVYLIAAHPLLRSDLSGPPNGTLIFLHRLGKREIKRLGEQTQIQLTMHAKKSLRDVRRLNASGATAVPNKQRIIKVIDEDRIIGIQELNDVFGQPAFLLQATLPRTIYQQGLLVWRWLYLACCASSLLFAVVILVLLERLVVSRVLRLSKTVRTIIEGGDLTTKVGVGGEDEIGELGSTMQEMFFRLNESQQALEKARAAAEAANIAKSRFVASVSHEVRTPLSGILGMTEVLLDSELPSTKRDHLSLIKDSALHLLDIINGILDFSKLEAGKMTVHTTVCSLDEILRDSLNAVAVRAAEKRLDLVIQCTPDLPLEIETDGARLRQVLVNLLGNAVKFTDKGQVTLRCSMRRREGGHPELKLVVEDTGPGIAPELQRLIFEPFVQADQTIRRAQQGTGLGLSIARQLVELMRGTIKLTSSPGEGTMFTVALPITIAGTETYYPAVEDRAALSGHKAAVCVMNQLSSQLIVEALSAHGAAPVECAGCDEVHQRLATGYSIAIVDGVLYSEQALDSLTSLLESRPETKVLVLLQQQQRLLWDEKFLQAGASAIVGCPFLARDVIKTLNDLLRWEPPPQKDARAGLPRLGAALRPLSVLIADDTKTNQTYLRLFFENLGHRVAVADNGLAALEQLGFVSGTIKPGLFDVVLMDVQMPLMDGLTTIRYIRHAEQDQSLPHLPIIAVTAHALTLEHERILQCGADAVVTKPVERGKLFAILIRLLAYKQEEEPDASGTAPQDSPQVHAFLQRVEAAAGGAKAMPPLFDARDLLSHFNYDIDAALTMIAIFVEEADDLLAVLDRAWVNGEAENIQSAAHTLKGSLANVGAHYARNRFRELERAAAKGRPSEASYQQSREIFLETIDFLKQVQSPSDTLEEAEPAAG